VADACYDAALLETRVSHPNFKVRPINLDSFAIDDHDKTVAILTPQGNVDWLLRSPMQEGEHIESILKETHLSFTRGLMIQLHIPHPPIIVSRVSAHPSKDGRTVVIEVEGQTNDGLWYGHTRAILGTSSGHARYEWSLVSTVKLLSDQPVTLKHGVEYCNIYPGRAGLGFLCESTKEYNCTLIQDRDGTIWKFPHQHLMHYSGCEHGIRTMNFRTPAMAGFFGEATGAPVCVCTSSPVEPTWGICDMYYDLHCQARAHEPWAPGQEMRFEYQIKYLPPAEARDLVARSRPVPVSSADLEKFNYPRLSLGLSSFDTRVQIDGYDDAAGFRPRPPVKVWDREEGHRKRGSLRITHEADEPVVWTAEPPVQGKGAFLRIRYFRFDWRPEPHTVWVETLESEPVTGTSDGWVEFEVPPLRVPEEHFDYLIAIDYVLDGKGVAWLTDVDIDLRPEPRPKTLAADFEKSKQRPRAKAGAGPRGA
jgi:hypothetical protein